MNGLGGGPIFQYGKCVQLGFKLESYAGLVFVFSRGIFVGTVFCPGLPEVLPTTPVYDFFERAWDILTFYSVSWFGKGAEKKWDVIKAWNATDTLPEPYEDAKFQTNVTFQYFWASQ